MKSASIAQLRQRWQQLASREQTLILLAAALTVVTLVWSLGLAPALRSLRVAPERRVQAEQQLRHMLHLQAQAGQLRQEGAQRAKPPPGNARVLLQESLARELGQSAQLQWQADGTARITLQGAPAELLAHWLTQVRAQTRATPLGLRLERAQNAQNASALWNGELRLSLPDGGGA